MKAANKTWKEISDALSNRDIKGLKQRFRELQAAKGGNASAPATAKKDDGGGAKATAGAGGATVKKSAMKGQASAKGEEEEKEKGGEKAKGKDGEKTVIWLEEDGELIAEEVCYFHPTPHQTVGLDL